MTEAAVDIKNLTKAYGDIKALDNISLQVYRGELFGFIGPDGAGKTSLFRILTTLLLPDGGSASVMGFHVVNDYKQIRRITGYMAGRFSLYQDLTVEENLSFYATVFGTSLEENYDTIKDIYTHIEPFRKRRAGKLSGGMKQKLALSCALIHKPEILILDEPTTGVDAVSRKEFWEMLVRIKEKGITILVSTPYMDEAGICDRVALMQNGRLLSVDTPDEIVKAYSHPLYSVRSEKLYDLLEDLRSMEDIRSVFLFGQCLHLSLDIKKGPADNLLKDLEKRGHKNIELEKISPGIEDCFMELMTDE